MKRVLLVHHTYGAKAWSLPGGMVEDGESAWEAAVRECSEEISIQVTDMVMTGMYFHPHRNAYAFVFRAEMSQGELIVDGMEIDEYGFFDLDTLPVPLSNFTVERIRDAAEFSGMVKLRNHHIDDHKIGGPEVWG
jgi:8-oxo-dGTP pyrophosphatase MutT (NUDIX family)